MRRSPQPLPLRRILAAAVGVIFALWLLKSSLDLSYTKVSAAANWFACDTMTCVPLFVSVLTG